MLQAFERRFGGLVEGAFARVFKGEVHPAEIAGALTRELDAKRQAMVKDRITAPNHFTVALGDSDYARLSPWAGALSDELADIVREHAAQEGYGFVGPVEISLLHDPSVGTGVFHLDSATVSSAAPAEPQPTPASSAPAGSYRPPVTPAAAPPTSYRPPVDPLFVDPVFDNLADPAPIPASTSDAGDAAPQPTVATRPPIPSGAAMTQMYGPRLVQTSASPQREHQVSRPVTVIGRAADNDIVLDDPGVSRRHAELRRTPDGIALTDLGSTNGTRVNGAAVTTSWLHTGDRIDLGTSVLVFRTDEG